MDSIYVNMDRSLIRYNNLSAARISREDFIEKLKELHEKHNEHSFNLKYINPYTLRREKTINEDLDEICFNDENYYCHESEFPCAKEEGNLMGVRTLDNGLTFLGCMSGGDWEYPIFYIVYFDGENLRAYIPHYGNLVDLLFGTAFGSEEENWECEELLNKYFPEEDPEEVYDSVFLALYLMREGSIPKEDPREVEFPEPELNWNAIKEDIESNIKIEN